MGSWPCGLSQQEIEQHGAHDRGDHREQDHHQTARPTTQGADLHSFRSHGLAPFGSRSPTDHLWPCPVGDRRTSDQVTGGGMARRGAACSPGHATPPAVGYDLVRRRVWAPRSWAFWVTLSARSWPCSWVFSLAVSAAVEATSWATCLPRSRASWPVSLTLSLTWSAIGPSFSSSTRVEGTASPARKPMATAPMASPSGFSWAMPAACRVFSMTSQPH